MEARPLGWKPDRGELPGANDPMMSTEEMEKRFIELEKIRNDFMNEVASQKERSELDASIGKSLIKVLWSMKETRGTERSERSRRIAICITELEKVIAYWEMWVKNEKP